MKILLLLFLAIPLLAQDWPEFRGPTGQGHSDERGLPLVWSETKNVRWKVALPGKGWSSPAILGERVWLTTATEEGKSLRAISVDRNTGAILQNVEIFRLKSPGNLNTKNSQASPTPVLEGDRVYLHFGAYGTACITQSGEVVWKMRLDYDNGQHGPGGSPIIYDNLLIGDAETVAEKLVSEIRAGKPVHICFSFKVGNTPHKAAMRSMELMMSKVKPLVEKALGPQEVAKAEG